MVTSKKTKKKTVRCNTLATFIFPTVPTIVNDRHEPRPVHKMAHVHNNDHKHKSAQRSNSRTDGITTFQSNHSCVGPRTCDWMQNADTQIKGCRCIVRINQPTNHSTNQTQSMSSTPLPSPPPRPTPRYRSTKKHALLSPQVERRHHAGP